MEGYIDTLRLRPSSINEWLNANRMAFYLIFIIMHIDKVINICIKIVNSKRTQKKSQRGSGRKGRDCEFEQSVHKESAFERARKKVRDFFSEAGRLRTTDQAIRA